MIDLPEGATVIRPDNMPDLRANPTAFDVVMRNLVSNAIKHSSRDAPTIEIRADAAGDFVTIEIEDDGSGIPDDYHVRIFEPFFKLRPHDEIEGSGLGLSFIQRAVEGWGGTIEVGSGQKLGGALFRFTVPRCESANGPRVIAENAA